MFLDMNFNILSFCVPKHDFFQWSHMYTNIILTVFKRLKSSNVKSPHLNGGGFGGGVNNFNTHTGHIFGYAFYFMYLW